MCPDVFIVQARKIAQINARACKVVLHPMQNPRPARVNTYIRRSECRVGVAGVLIGERAGVVGVRTSERAGVVGVLTGECARVVGVLTRECVGVVGVRLSQVCSASAFLGLSPVLCGVLCWWILTSEVRREVASR